MTAHTPISSEPLTRADVEQQLIGKAVEDENFRQALLENPQAIWQQEFGNTPFQELQLRVLEETTHLLYLVLPSDDEALRQELTKNPQAVWRREFGRSQLKGYTIRVVEEPVGQFYLVLPWVARSPFWQERFGSALAPPNGTLAQPWQNPSGSAQQRYRTFTQHAPKTKLGRIALRVRDWAWVMLLSNPLVINMARPFYEVRNWIYMWRRL